MKCDAKIRPMPNDTEIDCFLVDEHTFHAGKLKDYAFPGSKTIIEWHEEDRRTFHGDWPGKCEEVDGCVLPLGHRGRHAL